MTSGGSFFTLEHIRDCAFHSSLALTEQAIHCLELVRELAESGLAFQFKGGNSLLLVLDTPERFSIDVDIATDQPAETITTILDGIIKRYGIFTRWKKRQHKTKPWIPLSSYYLFYPSTVDDNADTSIMLDVQMHLSPYACQLKPVRLLQVYDSDATVEVPLPSSSIGDKLLTLGPATLGIPVGKGKEAQRLKHVFDVSRLLDMNPSLSAARESFRSCLAFENTLQQRTLTTESIAEDTLTALRTVVAFPEKPSESTGNAVLDEHITGHEPFAGHLFARSYSWMDLRIDMARVASCMAAVANPEVTDTAFEALFSDNRRKHIFDGEDAVSRFWNYALEWFPDGNEQPADGSRM